MGIVRLWAMGQCTELLVRDQNHADFIQQLAMSMKGMVRQKNVHLKIALCKSLHISSTIKKKLIMCNGLLGRMRSEFEYCNKFEVKFETA